jgi:benzodiazapine receptor
VKKILMAIVSVFICVAAGGIGSVFTVASIPTWYANINKPVFSPPNWIFGPVWTALYLMMGISLYLIWQKGVKNRKVALAVRLFVIQLVLNAVWSPVFFGARNLLLAFFIIIAMWFYILKTVVAFEKINKVAAYLLYPYLAWVSFASVLNFSVWILNR